VLLQWVEIAFMRVPCGVGGIVKPQRDGAFLAAMSQDDPWPAKMA
jgi:hypothetical protein